MSDVLSKNPYIVGPPVTGTSLYGRRETFRFVLETLATPANRLIVLYGQRRVGKTSILQELHLNRLSDAGFYSAYFNPQGVVRAPFAVAVHEMAAAIAETLGLPKPDLTDFEQEENYFLAIFLPQALLSLNGRRLVLLIDEFELFSREADSAGEDRETIGVKFLTMVEELITDERWKAVTVILVIGRRIEQLSPACAQLARAGHMHWVWLLSHEEAQELIIEPAQGILEYEPAAIEAILDLTAGHPYFVQLLCSEAFNHARWRRRNVILADDMEQVAARALESGATGLAWLWDDLSMAERLIVSAFSEAADETGLVSQASIETTLKQHQVRLGDLDLVQAINHLVEGRVLKHEGQGRYRFEVEMERRWAQEEHPIHKEKVRIEEISSKAAAFYAAAQHAHRQNRLDVAIDSYKLALANNPNHRSAQLGLAQALLDKKDLAEAVEASEEAFAMDRVKARAGLVAARLALGEELESQGQFVKAAVQFRRVLELDPENRRLQEKLRVLYDQGVKAMSAKRWRRAVTFLEQVTDIQPDYQDAAYRLKGTHQQAQAVSSRLIPVAVGGLLVLVLIGVGIGALARGSLSGKPTPTPTRGAVVLANDTPAPTVEVVGGTVETTPTLTFEAAVTEETTPTPSLRPTLTETPTPSATPTPIVTTATPTPIPNPIPLGNVEALDVEISPLNNREVYAIIKDDGVYRTSDGGNRWRRIRADKTLVSLTIAPSNPPIIYAAAFAKILRSDDRGETWQELQLGANAQVHAIAVVPNNPQALFAASDRGVFKSSDGGQNWIALDSGKGGQLLDRPFYTVIVASADGSQVYAAGVGDEVQWSQDAGSSPWQRYVCTVCIGNIYALAVDPGDSNRLYAASDLARLGVSTDGGDTWILAIIPSSSVPTLKFSTLTVDPSEPQTMYVGGGYRNPSDGQGLYRSTDSGLSWEPFNNWTSGSAAGTYVQGIAIDPTDSRVIYIAGSSGVYKSTDQGETWQRQ